MRAGTRILVVEDDESIAGLVELELEHRHFDVRCAYDGLAGLEELGRFEPEVVILDIMLPKLDGVGVLNRLRQQGVSTPVIMLTARDSSLDKVHSLDHGADDYLTKPFDIEELMARLRALVRRAQGEEVLRVGDLEVNTATRQVHRRGEEIELTTREYELLEFMARNQRQVLSRDFLRARVWEQEFGIGTNVVDVYVGYLRKKIDEPFEHRLIKTVRGVGYALRDG
jgi:two-component system response regulator MprA/two-component system response regulator TrcR